jgi:hypothetical protein
MNKPPILANPSSPIGGHAFETQKPPKRIVNSINCKCSKCGEVVAVPSNLTHSLGIDQALQNLVKTDCTVA